MKITWLGQAGLLFETDGNKILIDPYLSDNVKNFEPANYRRVPVDEQFLHITPDVIVITHNHLDHLDKETLKYYLTLDYAGLVLAPNGSWQELRKTFPCKANYVLFNNGTTWTEGNVSFRAVKAEHSDAAAIGVILSAEEKNYYVTGDTLYSEDVFASLPNCKIHALFLPINGKGNNMNMTDAKKFAEKVNPDVAVPMHCGLFDEIDMHIWSFEKKLVPDFFQDILF